MTARKAPLASRCIAGVTSLLLAAGGFGLLAPAAWADSAPLDPADSATAPTVTADALPTVQINGVAWSQVIVGNTVYVAGKFTSARPAGAAAGTQETVRNNFLAYDVRTGGLITSFTPSLNAQALAVTASPDGKRVYVSGDFTQANGQPRNKVAAYDTATGQLISTFKPSVSGQVRALAATNDTVYLGGRLTAVGSTSRSSMAAVAASNGALLPWAPVPGVGSTAANGLPLFDANGKAIPGKYDTAANARTSTEVMALVVTGGGTQVVAAGRFDSLNGQKSTGVGALDPVTGATRPFAINQLITNQGVNSAVYSLSTDGNTVYGTAYDYYGPGNLESAFAAEAGGGKMLWASTCRGDTYSSAPMGGALYLASHAHDCGNLVNGWPEQTPLAHMHATAVSRVAAGVGGYDTFTNANFAGKPAPSFLSWTPVLAVGSTTGQQQAAWSVAANGQYVVYGGEFPKVNSTTQQGLVRFALPGTAPSKMGPTGGKLTPTVISTSPGTARVSWLESTDQDNENLTYRVYRDNGTTPVHEVTSASSFWEQNALAFTDTGLSGGTHTYRVGVVDPSGNKNTGSWTSVTVAAGTTAQRAYATTVKADGATSLWSLGESAGTVAYDGAGGNDLTVNGGVTLGQTGAIAKDTTTGATTNGTTTGYLATKNQQAAPNTFSVEAWFSTTARTGGKIIGFGNNANALSTQHDRHVYMDANGRLNFGVYQGGNQVITSPTAYNDGRWHHVVASLSPSGMTLFVDGKQVGTTKATVTRGRKGFGYWRVGGDATWSGAQFFNGRIDEVAVYPTALTATQAANHYTAGSTGAAVNLPPTASFTSTNTDLTATLDASASTDADGTVASWGWNFGDGTTGTGRTATHTYKAAGTYGVTLTVTDAQGTKATRLASVTVTAPIPNVAPTAAFSAAAAGRTGSFDAAGSTDTDGTIAGYAWAFGDGSTGTGRTTSHEYAEDGTYEVTLTVTDDDGAVTSTKQTVAVVAAVLARDGFDRSVTGGLGAAQTGGAWTASAGGSRQSVADGTATFAMAKGTNTGSYLNAVSTDSADVQTAFSLSAMPTGGGAFVYVGARQVAPNTGYSAQVRVLADGSVGVSTVRFAGTSDAVLIGKEVIVTGLTYTVGTVLNVRVQASGTGTTTLSATVWADGTTQPATPTVTRTDTTPALQTAGAVGLSGYLSGSAVTPVGVRFASFSAVPVGTTPATPAVPAEPTPPANTAPTAAFSSTADDLTVAVDGAGSADADGTLAGYAWDFGDNATATGATASHTYTAAGTYTVALTVTDDDGATATTSKSVTVTAPAAPEQPAAEVVAADAFDRTVTGGLGTAEAGGAWTVSAGGTRQSVSGGAATFALTKGTNTGSYLSGVAETSVDVQTSLSLSSVPTGGGAIVYVGARRVGTNLAYQGRVRFLADGTVGVALVKQAGTSDDVLIGKEVVLTGLAYTPGTVLNVRVVASGTDTTQLSATVWAAGTTEPATPTVAGTDTTAGLQAAGSVGLTAYLSGSASAPVDLKFSEITVSPAA